MWSSIRNRLLAAAALAVVAGNAAGADGARVYLEVRLLPVAVTGSARSWDVTPVLEFADALAAGRACAALPAVVEAFVREVAVPVAPAKEGGGPDLGALAPRLLGRTAAVLGAAAPTAVHLTVGALRPADGAGGPPPFPAPRQCAEIGPEPGADRGREESGNGAR